VRGLVDHHEREREARVDAAGREPGEHLVDEGVHDISLVTQIRTPHGVVILDVVGGPR
jgi:hypothetical protein